MLKYVIAGIIIISIVIAIFFAIKMHDKIIYLNVNSTKANKNGMMNPSDLGYPDVLDDRIQLMSIEGRIKEIVGADEKARIIINSGSTESIANMMFWISRINKYGVVVGSNYDHGSVKDNAELYGLKYTTSDGGDDNVSAIFMTHVSGSTGEIMDIAERVKQLPEEKPLLILDAAQSICKVPIKMKAWGIDALFFSLHKIGGPEGLGILIIGDRDDYVPLIAGKQQHKLRGGTLPIHEICLYSEIFFDEDDSSKRIKIWNHAYDRFSKAGLKVYKPVGKHLYNTLLIKVDDCPLELISRLADEGIFVGNVSSCLNEEIIDGRKPSNDDFKAIRISFDNETVITDDAINKIIDQIQK